MSWLDSKVKTLFSDLVGPGNQLDAAAGPHGKSIPQTSVQWTRPEGTILAQLSHMPRMRASVLHHQHSLHWPWQGHWQIHSGLQSQWHRTQTHSVLTQHSTENQYQDSQETCTPPLNQLEQDASCLGSSNTFLCSNSVSTALQPAVT